MRAAQTVKTGDSMADCCCNNSQFGTGFGCISGGWQPVYGPTGPTGPTGPAAPLVEQVYAQLAQAQAVADGDLYSMAAQTICTLRREIVPGGTEVSLQPGAYMISYTVGTDGSTAGDYRVTRLLNGSALTQYSAGETAVTGEQSNVSATFIINAVAASVFQLRANVSAASMNQNVSVTIIKMI